MIDFKNSPPESEMTKRFRWGFSVDGLTDFVFRGVWTVALAKRDEKQTGV